jgi:hypothetical protein
VTFWPALAPTVRGGGSDVYGRAGSSNGGSQRLALGVDRRDRR